MISAKALAMIAHHEGTRYKPYRCPAALWTVGVGHVLYPDQAKLPMADRLTYPIKPEDNKGDKDVVIKDESLDSPITVNSPDFPALFSILLFF
jgi:GH24 family phage-related lysozyme (muramidase)